MKRTLQAVHLIIAEGAMTNIQIAGKLGITPKLVEQCMRQMKEGGSAKSNVTNGVKHWYIDKDCRLPQGITHAQVLKLWA